MANDFNEFNHYSWVITAYLLTYTGEGSLSFPRGTSGASPTNLRSILDHFGEAQRHIWPKVMRDSVFRWFQCLLRRLRCSTEHDSVVCHLKPADTVLT